VETDRPLRRSHRLGHQGAEDGGGKHLWNASQLFTRLTRLSIPEDSHNFMFIMSTCHLILSVHTFMYLYREAEFDGTWSLNLCGVSYSTYNSSGPRSVWS
jgi:hypothetical protein